MWHTEYDRTEAWSEAAAFRRHEKKLLAQLVMARSCCPVGVALPTAGEPLDGSGGASTGLP